LPAPTDAKEMNRMRNTDSWNLGAEPLCDARVGPSMVTMEEMEMWIRSRRRWKRQWETSESSRMDLRVSFSAIHVS